MSDINLTFDITDMAVALDDATDPKEAATPMDKEAAAARAREHNWVPRTAYDYSVYSAAPNAGASAPISGDDTPAWAANAAKYEWLGEYGDVGPAHPALEAQLFRNDLVTRPGLRINTLQEFAVTVEGPDQIRPIRRFSDAGLHPVMLQNIELCGFLAPTPIQAYTVPAALLGCNIVASAQTGSGKTAAYLVPILSSLLGKYKKLAAQRPDPTTFNADIDRVRAEPLVLIVAPTRELAIQIFGEARRLCYRSMLRPCVAYGGAPSRAQREELQKGCDVLIATPGRLLDYMKRPDVLSLSRVRYTVIDEADELLDIDWDKDMKQIMTGGDVNEDADHIYMMFSATFPMHARKLARDYMGEDYVRIRVGRAGSAHSNVAQNIVYVTDSKKRQALYDLLFSMPPARTLVFVNTKRQADLLDDYLYNHELPSTSIHSDRTQREREDALRAFRSGACPILVATGVSARGLDIKHVMHVVNFELPSGRHGGIGEYVHRIGRTARIGNEGLATSFYNEHNDDIADDLVKLLVESKQTVPDFLADRIPEGDKVEWDDDTDHEGETVGAGAGATGGGALVADGGAAPAAPAVDEAWATGDADTDADADADDGW